MVPGSAYWDAQLPVRILPLQVMLVLYNCYCNFVEQENRACSLSSWFTITIIIISDTDPRIKLLISSLEHGYHGILNMVIMTWLITRLSWPALLHLTRILCILNLNNVLLLGWLPGRHHVSLFRNIVGAGVTIDIFSLYIQHWVYAFLKNFLAFLKSYSEFCNCCILRRCRLSMRRWRLVTFHTSYTSFSTSFSTCFFS